MYGISIYLGPEISQSSNSPGFESISKFIIGSGLLVFVLSELWKIISDHLKKQKYRKEVAFEYFSNEIILKAIIKDYEELKRDPIGYLNKHRFSMIMNDLIITSGYFTKFSTKLSRFIVEFRYRFASLDYELGAFFKLQDEEKVKPQNIEHLYSGEEKAKKTLDDFRKSPVMIKLKNRYWKKWHKEYIRKREKETGIKISRRERKKIYSSKNMFE